MTNPITVLMPVYNAEQYLNEAIDSILQQTFRDFDFLIINDGSSDKSEEIILAYNDSRIRYVKNEKNIGLVATLNKGIDLIDTKYIVRMDADDLSVSHRLEVLYQFMENHPDIGVFSSALERFGRESAIWISPQHNDEIKARLLFDSSIAHAPCIMRTKLLKENKIYYRDIHPHMEDHDLWIRLKDLTNFENTSESLYKYRDTGENIKVKNIDSLIERKKKLFKWILNTMAIDATEEELRLHIGLANKALPITSQNVRKYKAWLDRLINVNKETKSFPHEALLKQIEERWDRLFFILPEYNYRSVITYIRLSKGLSLGRATYLFKYVINKHVFRKGGL